MTGGSGGRILATMFVPAQQRFRKYRRRGIIVSAIIAAAIVALTWFWLVAVVPYREHFTLYFPSNVHGLSVGAPVVMNGRTLGQVSEIGIASCDEAGTQKFLAAVTITVDTKKLIAYGRLRRGETFRDVLPRQISLGLRGQLRMPSLLASGLCVDLFFDPDEPARSFSPPNARYPEIPTNYKSTSELVDQANAFIETRNLYAFAGKIRALEKTVENFHAASKSFDCARANAKILSLLEQTDASLVPAKAHEELAALNEEILACRRELERGNALSPERAEHLRSTFRALSENLRDMRERARALREELEPENVEARRAFFRDLRERCAPLINFTKSVLF